ncbi:MAG TPA: hypothetical protein VK785_00485 [Opitutaceae bacterium]|jgi:hypothetical protein|nr:hypothetical protein [Opitutaceae bacterium]
MQTPTLIVRLAGLYLLANCSIALLQIHQMGERAGFGMILNIQIYAILGLVVGIAASLFAGPLANLLTFDSEPKTRKDDFTDRLLERKDEKA